MRSCGIGEQESVNFYLERGRQIGQTPPRHLFECDECYAWAETYYGKERAELFFSQNLRKLMHVLKDNDFALSDNEFEILKNDFTQYGSAELLERINEAKIPISEYL